MCYLFYYKVNFFAGGPKLQPNQPAKDLHDKIHAIKIPVITLGTNLHADLAKTVKMPEERKEAFKSRWTKLTAVSFLLLRQE